ncbi:unnamed protein product [Thlaspi arvense]|uniref:C-JID domain-containing protein n=1 Tax=Thlaspi arvense TaxID=13288 RepID=A0AAU9T291_THLAR|nr:unnamed protein product [Thlaspi arvense]
MPFPGVIVPTYFTYRATGSFLSMKSNGSDTHFPTSLRFKACVLLVPKGGVEADDMMNGAIVVCGLLTYIWIESSLISKEQFEKTVSSTELVFEFEVSNPECEIKECGLRTPETYAPSC